MIHVSLGNENIVLFICLKSQICVLLFLLWFNAFCLIINVIKGCSRPSVYGLGCDKQCPKNCESNICNTQEGFCSACKPGWTGQYCNTSRITYHNSIFVFNDYLDN